MLHSMERDLGASQNLIRVRKNDLGTEVSAKAEGMPITWLLTVNVNPALDFFGKNPKQQRADLFHELLHFYGAEDTGRDLQNAHVLDNIYEGSNINRILDRARYRTLRGLQ